MVIKFKKTTKTAKTPHRANPGDAGFDLYVDSMRYNVTNNQVCYHTGIAVEIPHGYVGLLYMRSSAAHKSCRMANATGVIDSGYRGEITAIFDVIDHGNLYKIGDRCCQLVITAIPEVEYQEVEDLSDSVRGTGRYGSSGN